MSKPLAVLAMALAIASCVVATGPGPRPPGPAQPPSPPLSPRPGGAPGAGGDAGGDLCGRAYAHMKDLGCPPPEPQGGGTWVDVCHNANAGAISMHEICILRVENDPNCTATEAARKNGCTR